MNRERWIVNICPLCRHQDNAHVGACPNRGKVFAYEQVVVAPEADRLTAASNAEGWKSHCEELREALQAVMDARFSSSTQVLTEAWDKAHKALNA